jgi:hypothetical protein
VSEQGTTNLKSPRAEFLVRCLGCSQLVSSWLPRINELKRNSWLAGTLILVLQSSRTPCSQFVSSSLKYLQVHPCPSYSQLVSSSFLSNSKTIRVWSLVSNAYFTLYTIYLLIFRSTRSRLFRREVERSLHDLAHRPRVRHQRGGYQQPKEIGNETD